MEMNDYLSRCVELQSSDLHLSALQMPTLRTHGELHHIEGSELLTADEAKRVIYSIMTEDEIKQLEEIGEVDFAISFNENTRFRVNAFHQLNGLAAVFRIIPSDIPTLDSLGYPPIFKELISMPNGLILVTGPTGSGKSTTMAAMVDYINATRAEHIITIEDPIEFTHKSKKSLINQRQVFRDTKSFAAALRGALREDPDVILLGEMRDLETIRLALTAAETGHLVLATLHTSSAPRTVTRVVDVFPAAEKQMIRNMFAESLQGVICQRLIPTMDGKRTAALEIMRGTNAIRNLIREDKIAQMASAIQTGSAVGMCTLDQYLQKLIANGSISNEVAKEEAEDKSLF